MATETEKLDLQLKYQFEHGVSLRARTIQLTGEIDTSKFELLDAALTELEKTRRQICIRINSEGGSVYDALAIVGRIKRCKAKIVTEGYGAVMSAATLILAAGDRRRMSEYGWFMIHESSYEIEGKHTEARAMVRQKEREEEQWAECMAKLSNKPKAFWKKAGLTDTYFTAQELKELGVIDEVF